MADRKINPTALSIAAAIVAAAIMLLLGILGNLGIYTGAVRMMEGWHTFFNLTPLGIIGGMIEAAIISFVIVYVLAWVYNRLTSVKMIAGKQ
jgi:hypothetical protein